MEKRTIREFANEYGWPEEVADLLHMAAWADAADEPALIWEEVEESDSNFDIASLALAWEVKLLSSSMENVDRNVITTMVSREATSSAFPLLQYLRELVQNAIDVSELGKDLEIKFTINESEMIFEHNGRSFRGPSKSGVVGEMGALCKIGKTTKKGNFNSVGKFGIGFKGWMIFFDSIQHEHTNGHTSVLVKYDYPSQKVILRNIAGPLKCKSSYDKPNTKFHFFNVRKDKTDEVKEINLYDILEEWTPMLRFVDNNVKINLDIHGETKVIEHKSKVLVPVNEEGFTILQFSTPIIKQEYFYCEWKQCDNHNIHVAIDRDTKFEEDAPVCNYCKFSDETIKIDAESYTENLVAIESRISRSDEITEKVREYIAQESDFYQSSRSANNPWNEVNEDDWYDQVRMRFGIETDYLQDNKTRPWLYSLAEITDTTGWIDGDYEKLHEDTAWSIDGPFFLHHNRKQLETALQSSKVANFTLIQQCLKRLVGRLAKFLHESESYSSLPLASPLDRMIRSYYDGAFENNATLFSPLIHETRENDNVKPLKNYSDVFGGLPIFPDASNTLINPNIARRIPSDWMIPGGTPLYQWITENTDLTLWPELPTHIVDGKTVLINEQSVKLLNFVEEIDKHVLFSRLNNNGHWNDLVNQYPSITKDADWLRVPLPENSEGVPITAIVGASSGWPSSLDVLVECLQEEGVLFTDDELIISVFCGNKSSGKWENRRDILTLSIPSEPEDVWWLNNLFKHAIESKVSVPFGLFEDIELILQHEDSKYFLSSLLHFPLGKDRMSLGYAIIPYALPHRTANEQTYVPRLGCSYSDVSGKRGNNLWNLLSSHEFVKSSDTDFLLYGEGYSKFEHLDNNPMLLIGEPLNPQELIDVYIQLKSSEAVVHSTLKGGFLIATPLVFDIEKLRQKAWTKLPSITLAIEPENYGIVWGDGRDYRGQHTYSTSSWNNEWKDKGVHKYVFEYKTGNMIGRLMSLSNDSRRKKEIIIRRLSLRNIILHKEFTHLRLDNIEKLDLITKLNEERLTLTSDRLSYTKLTRHSTTGEYYLQTARIQSYAQSITNLTPGYEFISQEQLSGLIDKELCGFSPPQQDLNEVEWIFDIATPEGWEEESTLWSDVIDNLDGLTLLRPVDCCGMTAKSLANELEGLAKGFRKTIDAVVDSDVLEEVVVMIARLLYFIDDNLPEGQENSLLTKKKNAITDDKTTVLIEIIESELDDQSDHPYHDELYHLKEALQSFQGMSYELMVEQWNEDGSPSEQWNYFKSASVLPKPAPVFQYDVNSHQFKRRGSQASINNRFVYISKSQANSIFGVDKEETKADANKWSLDLEKRLYIVDEKLEGMLNATPIHIPEKAKIPKFDYLNTNLEQVCLHPAWAFVQVLLGLDYSKENSIEITSKESLLSLIPNVVQVEENEPCTIFGHEFVHVGQTGWNLSVNQGQLCMQTNAPNSGHKDTLRRLMTILGFKTYILNQYTFSTNAGRTSMSSTFDIDLEILDEVFDFITKHPSMDGKPLLNPWGGGEHNHDSSRWGEEFGPSPDWDNDRLKSLDHNNAKDLLQRYSTALTVLLRRGSFGPSDNRPESDQTKLSQLSNIKESLKRSLYPNTASMICDEPILYADGEGIPTTGNSRRHNSRRERQRLDEAGLEYFLGNQLYLSRYMAHRATMTADAFGLRECPENTIRNSVNNLLNSEKLWGSQHESMVVLRDVMQVGDGNKLSLRVHKYHAICMCALDEALDEVFSE
jgi:hypothetical protein